MENPAATLHCPNISCQAPNPHSNKFCDKCRTPLLRRYLWAVGSGIEAYKPGEVIAGRYLLMHQRILLDTKPAIPPETPQEIPQNLAVYLRLSPYGLHFPQVYGRLKPKEGRRSPEIWLLEEAPLEISVPSEKPLREKEGTQLGVQLLPALTSVWKQAPALRQLNWLWQIASLWQPLHSEGVASSLLIPELLRVEGPLVRLLELQFDAQGEPTLGDLGQLWSQLIDSAAPSITGFLQQICDQLNQEQLKTSEQLVELLDQGLKNCGHSQSRNYQIFTRTDTGPSRHHNEDACYPPSGQLINPSSTGALAIVCDGIGGHEGGEVASQAAIETLRERLEKLPVKLDDLDPTVLTLELENAVCAANDSISQQNDSEHRSERQRMGTTLVMAKSCAHEMYITHVGDSRVYWITRSNCHQVTQDDDLASREVRLGYTLYRNAIQQPTSGSLVQALGMAPSTTLHPTVQRFVLDEDCVFLLCSDGLSDYDRVEQHWQTEILPILEGKTDLATAGDRLVEIANRQNGHDNVTIALVHCQVAHLKGAGQTELLVPQPEALRASVISGQTEGVGATTSRTKTQLLPAANRARRPWGLLLGIILLLGLGGAIAYILLPGVSRRVDPLISRVLSLRQNQQVITPSPVPASPSPSASPETSPSEQVQVNDLIQLNAENVPLRQGQNESLLALVPAGSVLQVTAKSQDEQQDNWLKLKVCSSADASNLANQPPEGITTPTPAPPSPAPKSPTVSESIGSTGVTGRQAQRGDEGWMRQADVASTINRSFTPTAEQVSQCETPSIPGSSTPTPTPTISSELNSPLNVLEPPKGKQVN